MNDSWLYPGTPPCGYSRLTAEAEMTACFTGFVASRFAAARYAEACVA